MISVEVDGPATTTTVLSATAPAVELTAKNQDVSIEAWQAVADGDRRERSPGA